jgi:hypothetical protein
MGGHFGPEYTDAVTSATITSAASYRGLNEGQVIFKELEKKGLI